MSSVNKVTLLGHVGKTPEIRTSQSGQRFASFSLATSEYWKDKNTGERKDRTEWHNITISNDALVGLVERFVKKGSKIYLEGQLQTRKWTDNDGNDRYTTEVALRPFTGKITLIDSKDGNKSSEDSDDGAAYYQAQNGISSPPDDLDDEIPF